MAIISLVEYAKRNGKNLRSVRDKALRGNLRAFKSGKIWLIDEDEPYVDMRRKGHNESIKTERSQRENNTAWVLFFKDPEKHLHAYVGKGLQRDLKEQFADQTGYRYYYSVRYDETQILFHTPEELLLEWIEKYKDHHTRVKRDAVVKYLYDTNNIQDILNQYDAL